MSRQRTPGFGLRTRRHGQRRFRLRTAQELCRRLGHVREGRRCRHCGAVVRP